MTTITTRSGKGSPLTNNEVDANFTNLNTDKVETSGDSMTGNLSFGDNNKSIFGAGSDLQIFHDGSNSFINEAGTGDLSIKASNNLYLMSGSSELYAKFTTDGAATLYHNNAAKLATTSSGIDVSGSVTADALTVDGNTTNLNYGKTFFTNGIGTNKWQIWNDNGGTDKFQLVDGDGHLVLQAEQSGDISFFEDTGTSPKMVWKSADERLGIGTSSPTSLLHLSGTYPKITLNDETGVDRAFSVGTNNETFTIRNETGSADVLAITNTNNVGIGTSSPAYKLQANGSGTIARFTDGTSHMDFYAGSNLNEIATASPLLLSVGGSERMRIDSSGEFTLGNSSGGSALQLDVSATGTDGVDIKSSYYSGGYGPMKFYAGGSERLRINSNGNVGINNQSPAATLHTVANSGTTALLTVGASGNNIASFYTSGSSQVMTLDASGNLLVGRTSTSGVDIDGHVLFETGASYQSITSNSVQFINRNGTDGSLLSFYKGGSPVGIIGTVGGHLAVGGGDVFLEFNSTGDALQPMSTVTGGASNGAVDLGASLRRFKDLHLSGTVNVGGSTVIDNNRRILAADGAANVPYITFSSDTNTGLYRPSADVLGISTGGSERARIDASGNLLVGLTSVSGIATGSTADNGIYLDGANGAVVAQSSANKNLYASKATGFSDPDFISFQVAGSSVGSIGTSGGSAYIGGYLNAGLYFNGTSDVRPWNTSTQTNLDNSVDLGNNSARFDDIYATNGTIQTSDRNEKQDIEALSDAEQRVAVAAKGLLRKFRWIDSVEEKGDEARIHFGIIAQDLQDAFTAEGLDAGRYAMFINSTWTDEETGEERSRMGVRYSELLAFIIAAI
jgi:hypothetical protein